MNKEIKRIVKCDVCKMMIDIDKSGNGECKNCEWRQSEESFRHPNVAGIRNIPSLNNAIKQYNNGGKATLANYDDFANAYRKYGEVEFTLNQSRFGVLFDDTEHKVTLLNIQTGEKQFFNDIEDFVQNSKLNGMKLKDVWNKVTNTDFLQDT